MVKQNGLHESAVQSNIDNSLFGASALHNAISDCADFDYALSVFRRESSLALLLEDNRSKLESALRRERYKTFILKMLLFIGVSPNGNGVAVLARLIEILALNTVMMPDDAIMQFAKTHSTSIGTVERIVESHFNIYNEDLISRVCRLTQSQPMTPKDVLCDLSVFVRMNFMQEIRL